MIYFKKENYFFYRLNPETFACTEVFNSITQRRVLLTVDEQIYNQTLNRIQSAGFVPCTADEFQNLLTHVLIKLSS
jgi:hypothetical protein